MIISVGSQNQAKLNSVRASCPEGSTVLSVDVPSEVSNQPIGDEETLQGAINRARNALKACEQAEAGIGLEGGVMWIGPTLYLCNWGAMVTADNQLFTAGGARIPLPDLVVKGLEEGKELGDVMDEYAHSIGTRQHQGAIGILTQGAVTRLDMFTHVTKLLFSQSRH
ncbi:DUF84 family protein [Pullulanibacillus sp. KACC 23026]|uniref:DUF84 family protein n=1 Tax=Pullulanibacillus sp. KACC 23026 TaxID=3028315 RepID=UPI0023AF470B|nr:DUF84 family protein [Pullulanibacillus sp. KACC 23026]WEG13862.1 DUF84 family protein [Pullulanibacillus sp. KACC 23026]